MKFARVDKYGRLEITERKLKLIKSKPERQRQALAKKLPLLVELIEPAPTVDVDAVIEARQSRVDAAERRMRSLYARIWRDARKDYFAADAAIRAAIRVSWDKWTGPRTCSYFRYVVDLETGVMAQRSERFFQQQEAIKANYRAHREANPQLF